MTRSRLSRRWVFALGVLVGIWLTLMGQSVQGLYDRVQHIEFFLEYLSHQQKA